ncbi:hypothetical protein K8I85_03665 [bacterium]|nr:hypothetical protein [bacterium]
MVATASGIGHQYVSQALQGDLSGAAALFASADPEQLDDGDRALAASFERRFVAGEEDGPLPDAPFTRDVVRAYHAYWRAGLLGEAEPDAAEASLRAELRRALVAHGMEPGATEDETMERMGEGLRGEGYYHLSGRTLPFLELMLWARQDTTSYHVELTDETRDVDVVFLRDFVVRCWSHWATFGHASTGGWAGEETLFCLGDEYDVESEHFRESYLRHETRHFADYARFPALEQIDLEYRAKLTELVYADSTLIRVVLHFARSAAPRREAPHAFANDAVIRAMSRAVFDEEFVTDEGKWRAVDPAVIHRAAAELLERSTRELLAAGAETTKGVVGS